MDLEQLEHLTELKFRKSEQAVSQLLVRENELRRELSRLRELARETHSHPPGDAQLRAIGGDVIWLRWIGQTQRALNIQLAQVLAQKERLMGEYRRAHGKKLVAEALLDAQTSEKRAAHQKHELENAIEQAVAHPRDQ